VTPRLAAVAGVLACALVLFAGRVRAADATAFAARTLPTIEEHLEQARRVDGGLGQGTAPPAEPHADRR
jgi:hypothetical protein